MLSVYLCARYGRRDEIIRYADTLERMGHTITSRWLNGPEEDEATLTHHHRSQLALMAYVDIKTSNALIAFTEQPDSPYGRGGRHVELGIALASNVPNIIVIGPRENIFCDLALCQNYASFGQFINRLKEKSNAAA